MFHAGLQVLDSTLPAAHVISRSYRALSDTSTQRPQASRTHVGYLPKVDDMLGLSESPAKPSLSKAVPQLHPPSDAAAEDPFAASAHMPPEGVSGGAQSGGDAEGTGAAAAAAEVAEPALQVRETEMLLDDSDSELEADLVFAHVMARRPGAHAAAEAEPCAAEQPAPATQEAAAVSQAEHAPADRPEGPDEGFREGESSREKSRGCESQSEGAEGGVPEALSQTAEQKRESGEATQQIQAINSDLMSSMIHSPDAKVEEPPGTSHASLPPMQSEQVITSRATQETQAQGHVHAASTGDDPAAHGDATANASASGAVGAEGPGVAGAGHLVKRSAQKRAKPSHKAVAAMWELLESCIAPPQTQDTAPGTVLACFTMHRYPFNL